MIKGIWGKKIGMTQVFSENKVVPVTVIDTGNWFVTSLKNKNKDGYEAIQVGCVRKKYENESFSPEWLRNKKKYFLNVKEIRNDVPVENVTVGQSVDFAQTLEIGSAVDAFGTTIGRGFQGCVKRHGFAGGPASHGSMFKRRPGTMSFMRSRGRVIKGKRLPGHMGVAQCVVKNLEVVRVEPESKVVLVKGSMPGKSGSLVYLRKVS
jgi:large subunit ribosomal protein L3